MCSDPEEEGLKTAEHLAKDYLPQIILWDIQLWVAQLIASRAQSNIQYQAKFHQCSNRSGRFVYFCCRHQPHHQIQVLRKDDIEINTFPPPDFIESQWISRSLESLRRPRNLQEYPWLILLVTIQQYQRKCNFLTWKRLLSGKKFQKILTFCTLCIYTSTHNV